MKKDYLAIILLGAGSSHARGPDLEDCVKRVGKIVVSDWSSLFDVKGKPAKVGCYDVTGHDSLYWDARGVFASKEGEEKDVEIALLEVRDITLPTK